MYELSGDPLTIKLTEPQLKALLCDIIQGLDERSLYQRGQMLLPQMFGRGFRLEKDFELTVLENQSGLENFLTDQGVSR